MGRLNLQPSKRHERGFSGFWNASAAVFLSVIGLWEAIDGVWGPAALFLALVPLAVYEALMKYRAGNWWRPTA